MSSSNTVATIAESLEAKGVRGLTIGWIDNNGIPRARIVPIAALPAVAARGVGVTSLFAVFDSHDSITHEYAGLSTPSGDVRLFPVIDRIRQLAGQPHLAFAPAYQTDVDGAPSPYDQRATLQRQVDRATKAGYEFRFGFELEFALYRDGDVPAHGGPAYSPHALLSIDAFVEQLLSDLASNGLEIGQLHAEYGSAQVEINLAPADPLGAADDQLLARQTIHAAAAAHGLRASFAPLTDPAGVGNGWHLHSSLRRDGVNLLAPTGKESDRHGISADGTSYLAGLLAELPAISALTAPSVPSRLRLRPGYFAGAYAFWGVENREATLRYVATGSLLGPNHANVELKVSDASANPYLAIAAVIAAGLSGIERHLELPAPIQQDPGTWTDAERDERGIALLPQNLEDAEAALLASDAVRAVLSDELLGAFLAVRHSDGAWASERSVDEQVSAHKWLY
jgi:glutamine synthetase